MIYHKKAILIALLIIVLCLCLYAGSGFFSKTDESFILEGNETKDGKFGFIITRHVNSQETNKIWKMCINQLRKVYPSKKIIIIDDNSNYEFVTQDGVDLSNCEVIDSEFKKRGELLPYYYFYKNKWFDKAIFIHDSVFINNKIPAAEVSDVKFLWYFNAGEHEDMRNIERILSVLKNKDKLITTFRDKNSWKGCWGVMSVIQYDFLKRIFEKYDMVRLLDSVNNRDDRMAMERVFGIICIREKPELLNDPSIFGYYNDNKNNRNSDNYTHDEYVDDITNNKMKCDINKLFFGR
jgi:hypothetical protein